MTSLEAAGWGCGAAGIVPPVPEIRVSGAERRRTPAARRSLGPALTTGDGFAGVDGEAAVGRCAARAASPVRWTMAVTVPQPGPDLNPPGPGLRNSLYLTLANAPHNISAGQALIMMRPRSKACQLGMRAGLR